MSAIWLNGVQLFLRALNNLCNSAILQVVLYGLLIFNIVIWLYFCCIPVIGHLVNFESMELVKCWNRDRFMQVVSELKPVILPADKYHLVVGLEK